MRDLSDDDLEAFRTRGASMVTGGIVLLVVTLLGTCAAGAAMAGRGSESLGESPFVLLPMCAAIALIALGQVKKINVAAERERRLHAAHTTITRVPAEHAPGGPFRGALDEVPVLDPVLAAAEAARRTAAHRRGTRNLWVGGLLLLGAILLIVRGVGAGGSERARVEAAMIGVGLAFVPFVLGLIFAIRGALQRSS